MIETHPRRQGRTALTLAALVALTGCGGSAKDAGAGSQDAATLAAAASMAAVDACSLLTDAEVRAVAPSLSGGHPGTTAIPHVSTCEWDNTDGLPAVMLQVEPRYPSGVKAGMEEDVGSSGYTVTAVPGLGDDAAVATQPPDPAHGLEAGVALLAVRVGGRQLGLSPVGLHIKGPDAPGFADLRKLAAKAAGRLRAAGS